MIAVFLSYCGAFLIFFSLLCCVRGFIKKFVDLRDKIDTMSDKTFNLHIFHIIANFQVSCVNENKNIEYLVVHFWGTCQNLNLCSETKFDADLETAQQSHLFQS